ncbi:hypothetical protein NH8B_2103 [Pseudogulbenkiania sp. NH8B]|uniref:hypothetical protein n=1 Tax=Pseudogulbenkiania sp. (strain NH8B) TaxID=748280 RepID=UPI0002279B54|nr:hypothetical protein [Pseudogulbenkiania sp. NH8B]BAK76489.1 hypothetical protein NH8B_1672 [Pseudogulbenkiania sp. NH8B]BAK76918.1 hypothetical protein NH8B_2103 [Pseudogulbenkiania sp. NH8B]
MPTVMEQLLPGIALVEDPRLSRELVDVGPAALAAGTLVGVAALDDELAVPWIDPAAAPPAILLGIVPRDIPAAEAGVTSRPVEIVAGAALVALDELLVLASAQATTAAIYRKVVRELSQRGIRLTERS